MTMFGKKNEIGLIILKSNTAPLWPTEILLPNQLPSINSNQCIHPHPHEKPNQYLYPNPSTPLPSKKKKKGRIKLSSY